MHSRFDRFKATPLAGQLEALIDAPYRYAEYAVLSRVGVAAIAAVAGEIAQKFPEIGEDPTARQYCGALVAEVMRRHGHEVAQARGRVSGALFSYGAVFSAQPLALPFEAVIDALATMPERFTALVKRTPMNRWARRPQGTGFSLLEHACHLRDLDAVFAERFSAVRKSHLPEIVSVNGTALAEEREYMRQDLVAAMGEFGEGRRRLCASLKRLTPEQRLRCGLRDGVRRMTLEELVRELLDHDRTHALELDELESELREVA
ncbi:DinB family protein [Paraburkholderia unamae]|uniref:DinB family protein n=1 Tax=Paraburkholderia unamae TaxID=219649 RepID=A0ABX5KVR4_9BURK|nr:DinB family protein [Paraburkholderia unamae]PVX86312.1 DinB family protein [Paraburkholderia unamae]CAG9264043.1 DinB family protein [Paraburkholderia unamae]